MGESEPGLAGLAPAGEGRVDVFEEDDGALGRVGEEVVELVVGEAPLGKVQHADVVLERAGERLDEGRLARARRADRKSVV